MEIVNRIPGGWYGNDPGAFPAIPRAGTVVVDARFICQAVKWLGRRAIITSTTITSDQSPGLLMTYEMKRISTSAKTVTA